MGCCARRRRRVSGANARGWLATLLVLSGIHVNGAYVTMNATAMSSWPIKNTTCEQCARYFAASFERTPRCHSVMVTAAAAENEARMERVWQYTHTHGEQACIKLNETMWEVSRTPHLRVSLHRFRICPWVNVQCGSSSDKFRFENGCLFPVQFTIADIRRLCRLSTHVRMQTTVDVPRSSIVFAGRVRIAWVGLFARWFTPTPSIAHVERYISRFLGIFMTANTIGEFYIHT